MVTMNSIRLPKQIYNDKKKTGMHTILMLPGCPISKVIDSWKFAIGNSFFTFEYNPTFTNGDPVTIQLT
jgi:hypothetical protein